MILLQLSETWLEAGSPAEIGEDQGDFPVPPTLLERAALATLQHQGASPQADLTIVLGTDDQLQELNSRFLGIDAPTDVLSFPSGELDPETGETYLGDVILSYERAADQAAAGSHTLEDELQLLVVHGVLHLLGYDHASPGEKATMWAVQAEILTSLGAGITGPQE